MQELAYDIRYKIAGELHFFTRARQQGARFKNGKLVIVRKPFAVGVSSDFTERVKDRVHMLEEFWGAEFPVRERITFQLMGNTARTYNLDQGLIEGLSLEEFRSTLQTIRMRPATIASAPEYRLM